MLDKILVPSPRTTKRSPAYSWQCETKYFSADMVKTPLSWIELCWINTKVLKISTIMSLSGALRLACSRLVWCSNIHVFVECLLLQKIGTIFRYTSVDLIFLQNFRLSLISEKWSPQECTLPKYWFFYALNHEKLLCLFLSSNCPR